MESTFLVATVLLEPLPREFLCPLGNIDAGTQSCEILSLLRVIKICSLCSALGEPVLAVKLLAFSESGICPGQEWSPEMCVENQVLRYTRQHSSLRAVLVRHVLSKLLCSCSLQTQPGPLHSCLGLSRDRGDHADAVRVEGRTGRRGGSRLDGGLPEPQRTRDRATAAAGRSRRLRWRGGKTVSGTEEASPAPCVARAQWRAGGQGLPGWPPGARLAGAGWGGAGHGARGPGRSASSACPAWERSARRHHAVPQFGADF